MVLKLATTLLHCTIAIRKLNNITINCFQSLRLSVLPDKQRFDTNQDWEVLGDDFDSISLDTIPDNILQALNFHLFPLSYLEEGASRFVAVTDNLHLTIELIDNGQPITDSKDERMRKQNKRAAKRKAQLGNLRTPVWAPVASFAALLLFCSALVSHLESPASLSSCPGSLTCSSPLLACSGTPTVLLSCPIPAPILGSPAVLSPFPVLGPTPLYLASTAFRIFKKALSDKPLRR